MDMHLNDKVAIVTVGESGIGGAISKFLLEEGAKVVIASRSEEKAKLFLNDLKNLRDNCLFIKVELAREDDCKSIVDLTLKEFGRIDILVHNAGVNDGVKIEDSPHKFMSSLQNNIMHVFALTHFAIDELKKHQGSILMISSKVSVTGQGKTSGYAASKGAMNSLTREWAVDFKNDSIRVNCIVPAEVLTPQYESWLKTVDDESQSIQKITGRIPLENRFTKSEEIANMACFLVSKNSSHTTGQILHVDGGYVHLDRACSQED